MIPISTLFSTIFSGCTEKEAEPETTPNPINPDPVRHEVNNCVFGGYYYEVSTSVVVDEADLVSLLDAEGQITEEACVSICNGADLYYICTCEYIANSDEGYEFECTTEGGVAPYEGRGNAQIDKRSTGSGSNPMAQWSANAYHAEASSVAAFLQIRKELDRFGAPKTLLDRCLKAACDEIAHAQVMRQLCLDNGGTLSELSFGEVPLRSLLDFAIDVCDFAQLCKGCL